MRTEHRETDRPGAVALGSSDGRPSRIDARRRRAARRLSQAVAAHEGTSDDDVRLVEVADRGAHPQRIATGFAGGLPHDVFLVSLRRRVSTKKLTVRLRR